MIVFDKVSYTAGAFALDSISFAIPQGRYAVLMGKTGQGKTTLLEMLCGLRQPKTGRIWIGEHDVTRLSPAERRVAYVPQDLALFPTMNVREHLDFAPRLQKVSPRERKERHQRLAEELGITHLLERSVVGLSGGEAQRVALGRALAAQPLVLLLDEPLSALDDQTRGEMYKLLVRVTEVSGVTTLHVTHNQDEAERLGDVQLRLVEGEVVSRESGVGSRES